jgi:hypothetical protein
MKITLYQAAAEVQDLMAQMDPETGELPEEFGSALQLAKDRAGAVAAALVNNRVHREAIKNHALAILEQVKKEEAKEARWEAYLLAGMQSIGATKITDPSGVTLVQRWPDRDTVVQILDDKQIPAEYMREYAPPPPKPNKVAIAQAIKDGLEVPGAKLVKRDRIKVGA